jgi:hypothetical protein
MAGVNVTITSVATVVPDPADISNFPPPWTVIGTSSSGTGNVNAMGYSINDGPVNGLPGPFANYSFNLTNADLPNNGTYLLAVYAWDDDTASPGAGVATRQIRISTENQNTVIISIGPPP